MKISTHPIIPRITTATTTPLAPEALPLLSPAHRSRSQWPKRRTTLTLQTGLERPTFAHLSHERSIASVARQPYSHGGFMALTRSFWQDATWVNRLTQLMPEARSRIDALIGSRTLTAALPEVMALIENNPVLAAYGVSRAGNDAPAIEWDIWLSPRDASDLHGARVIHGNQISETIATEAPESARLIVDAGVGGTDVHTGLSVHGWKAIFERALGEAGVARHDKQMQPLFLDVKSSYSTAEDIDQFVASLATAGFLVKSVGTFAFKQLDGLKAALPVHLFDTAEDLVEAQMTGVLPEAAAAMFNGGFLLKPKASDPSQWQIDVQTLKRVARVQSSSNLKLAIYIQETRANWQALDCLTRCINANAHIFAMGFAYSGLAGVADTTTASGRGVAMLYAQAL